MKGIYFLFVYVSHVSVFCLTEGSTYCLERRARENTWS